MLDVRNASLTFAAGTGDENRALQGLSLHLDSGDFVTIIGTNGAGKSTLFNVIAGALRLDSGSIELDGEDITRKSEHVRARKIGRLFQDPRTGTAPDLTIEENLALVHSKTTGSFPLGMALNAKNRAYFRDVLARLGMGLENRLKSKVGLLSGGQRQALTLLLATLTTPKLLMLDEHTAALDPVSAKKVLRLTQDIISKDNITTLMITHNVTQALESGNRTIMMHNGGIVMDLNAGERRSLTQQELLARYKNTVQSELDSDRLLFG